MYAHYVFGATKFPAVVGQIEFKALIVVSCGDIFSTPANCWQLVIKHCCGGASDIVREVAD